MITLKQPPFTRKEIGKLIRFLGMDWKIIDVDKVRCVETGIEEFVEFLNS